MAPSVTFLAVVGESYRQDALARLLTAHPDRACPIALVPEPENPADANAIKVVSADDGAMLGYLSRANAPEFHQAVAALGPDVHYRATIHGGTEDKPSVGISFDAKPLYEWQDHTEQKDDRAQRAKARTAANLKALRRELREMTRDRDDARRALDALTTSAPAAPAASEAHASMKTCPYCAEQIQDAAIVCRFCGRSLTDAPAPSPTGTAQSAPTSAERTANPGVAAVLSFFIPGLGHIYRGDVGLGIGLLFITILGYALFIVPGVILHIVAIVSAYRDPKSSPDRNAPSATTPRGPYAIRDTTPEEAASDRKVARFAVLGVVVMVAVFVAAAFFTGSFGSQHDRAATSSASAAIPAVLACGDLAARYRYDASDQRGHLTITTVSAVDAKAAESIIVDCLRDIDMKYHPDASIIGSLWRSMENRSLVRVSLPDKSDSILLSTPLHALIWASGKQEPL